MVSPPPAMDSLADPRSTLTARLAELKAERRRTRRNARWVGTVVARQLGEEAAESVVDKLPLGLGLAASAGFAVSDWRKARTLAAIAAHPDQPADVRERAGLEARIYRRAAGLEVASGAAATVPGIGTAAAVGTDAAAISLETRDRVRLEELGGSVLGEIKADQADAGISRSLQRSLRKLDDWLARARDRHDVSEPPERGRTR